MLRFNLCHITSALFVLNVSDVVSFLKLFSYQGCKKSWCLSFDPSGLKHTLITQQDLLIRVKSHHYLIVLSTSLY